MASVTATPKTRRHRRRPRATLARRILALNLLALAVLAGGILSLSPFREGLIESRLAGLTTQAEIIAGALGEAATGGPDATQIEIGPARQILRRFAVPTESRARLFNAKGVLIANSIRLIPGRQVVAQPLPPPSIWANVTAWLEDLAHWLVEQLQLGPPPPAYIETTNQTAANYAEAQAALEGQEKTAVRVTDDGTLILTVAVPVQRFKRVLGALLVSVETTEIEEIVRQERLVILEVFAIALVVTVMLSLVFSGTIARPVRKLAAAAKKVSGGHRHHVDIPDFSTRRDEIGELSRALRDMTGALYARISATEAFAADVAHEIKNPLTSLRSAIETLRRTHAPDQQEKLLAIVQDDVRRIDRLISEISDASRVDAELYRAKFTPVDIASLLENLVDFYGQTARGEMPRLVCEIDRSAPLVVQGVESRLGQVVRNLLDNAASFTTPDGVVTVRARREDGWVVIEVADDGPGIPQDKLAAIFERFYTERPESETFGQHSGLGLSICKQIIEAHGGVIFAENRPPEEGGGARMIVRLPG